MDSILGCADRLAVDSVATNWASCQACDQLRNGAVCALLNRPMNPVMAVSPLRRGAACPAGKFAAAPELASRTASRTTEVTTTKHVIPCVGCTEPGKVHQAWNYAEAVTKWKLAGSPLRPQQEIDRIFALCQACPLFIADPKRPRCRLCGCSLNQAPDGLNNKIAMATENCPLDPPKW